MCGIILQTQVLVFASSAPLLLQKKRQSQAEKEREKKSRKEKEAKRKEEKKRERKRPNPNPNALTKSKSKSKSISEMPFEPTDRYRVRAARSKTDGIGVDNGTDDEGWVGFGMEGWMKP